MDLAVTITANDQATSKIEALGSGVIAKGVAVGNLVSSGIQKAGEAIVGFGVDSINTGKEFDSAMSQVAATMGLTTDDIGDLRNAAQEMGATTSFSATQAAEGLNYMALAGYSSEQAIATLPTVLNLAAAGAMELGAASDMVTDAQTALGLSLDDTVVMVDQMAQTASKSNTSVAQLGDAILTVGGTAKNLAGGITEMNTVLGVMADNGIKGSEAGTHLRNIILSLTAPTDTAATALDSLGISASDAEGNMRPLQDVMQDFNAAFADMTSEEKTQALSTIFNKTDLASVNALLDTSVDRWEQLSSAIDDSAGAAEQMANTQLDNLAGDMTLLQSAIEGTQVALSDMMTPALREMAQTASSSFSDIASAMQSGDIASAAESFGSMVGNLATQIISHIPDIANGLQNLLYGFINGLAQTLPQMIPAIVQAILGLVDVFIQNIPLFVQAAVEIALGLAVGLVQAIPQIIEAIPQIVEALITALLELGPTIIQAFVDIFSQIDLGEALNNLITAVGEWAGNMLMKAAELGQQFGETLGEWFSQLPEKIGEFIGMVAENVGNWAYDMISRAGEMGSNFISKVVEFFTQLPGKVGEFISNVFSKVGEWAGNMAAKAGEMGQNFLSKVVEFFTQLPGKVAEFLSNVISNVANWVTDMFGKAQEAGQQFLQGVTDTFQNVINFFVELPQNILNALGDLGSLLVNAGSQIINGLLSGLQGAIGGVWDFVSGIGSTIASLKGPEEYDKRLLIPNGGWIMDSLASGLEKGFPAVEDVLKDTTDALASHDYSLGVKANVSPSGYGSGIDRNFVFNVEINNTGQLQTEGRRMAEVLFTEYERMERTRL